MTFVLKASYQGVRKLLNPVEAVDDKENTEERVARPEISADFSYKIFKPKLGGDIQDKTREMTPAQLTSHHQVQLKSFTLLSL